MLEGQILGIDHVSNLMFSFWSTLQIDQQRQSVRKAFRSLLWRVADVPDDLVVQPVSVHVRGRVVTERKRRRRQRCWWWWRVGGSVAAGQLDDVYNPSALVQRVHSRAGAQRRRVLHDVEQHQYEPSVATRSDHRGRGDSRSHERRPRPFAQRRHRRRRRRLVSHANRRRRRP